MKDDEASITIKGVKNVNITDTTIACDRPAIDADEVENFNLKNFLHTTSLKSKSTAGDIKSF